MSIMKAITICQPYAHLIIVTLDKRVENREWPTRYRGPLLIHAGKSRAWLEGTDEENLEEFGRPLDFGMILGMVQLVDCLHIDEIRAGKHDAKYPWLRTHHHTNGTWCWIFENAVRFETPIPYTGRQGLFNVPWAQVA